jgi:pimeloyl-ACP methyl ester carboxylesterase
MPATPIRGIGDSLRVPGSRLHYEVRGRGPLLALVGSPMDAEPFQAVAELLATDHTVLTTDPRGIRRSRLDGPAHDATPEARADDVSRLLTHLDAGPAAVIGSSGGAVTALALAQAHPEQVRTVVAHEPPLDELLDDHEQRRVETQRIVATYLDGDVVGAWKAFFAQAELGLADDVVEQMFGGERDPQTVADEHFFFAHSMLPTTSWRPDLPRLRSVATRIVVGVGEDSAGQLCDRTARALATALDVEPVSFPRGHIGFVEDPGGVAARLRRVLSGSPL